jgi:hypothetical protein
MQWGLLGPETLTSLRRTRTLGLASAVRHYNERAVPGMGNIWFVRQLYLALLGIAAAEKARHTGLVVSNIEVANAIEALGSWLTLKNNHWQRDSRLRGATKLYGTEDVSFAKLRKRGAYVTQPMRMATIQPLHELGFVTSSSGRFNAYECTDLALEFIDLATKSYRPNNRSVLDNLLVWIQGGNCVDTRPNRMALSSVEFLSKDALDIFRNQIMVYGDGAARRKAAMEWVDDVANADNKVFTWKAQPKQLTDEHWRDLRTGGVFFQLRDAAVYLLDLVEARLGRSSNMTAINIANLNDEKITLCMSQVRQLASKFLDEDYDASPDRLASYFCLECNQDDNAAVIRSLIDRDGHVLRRNGDSIRPGPAFRRDAVEKPEPKRDESNGEEIVWPEGISGRIQSLFYMNADLNGSLDSWIGHVKTELESDDDA